MTIAAPSAAKPRGYKRDAQMSTTPSWDTTYLGIIGAQYTEHAGMFFEVHRSRTFGWWHVDRIDRNGHYLGETIVAASLRMVTLAIITWQGHRPPEVAMFDRTANETMCMAEMLEEAL